MFTNRLFTLWLFLLLASLGVSIFLTYQGMTQPTGPRQLRWFDHQRKPLFGATGNLRVSSCRGDRYFRTLSVGHYLWTVCVQGLYTPSHHARYLSGVYVRFDMKRKVADARWPLPKEDMLYHTLGLLPNHKGQLGIVYRSRHSHGPLVVAIAGEKGWWVTPKPLPERYSGRLLGMRWSQGRLSVVVTESRLMDRLGLRSPAAAFRFQPKSKSRPQVYPRTLLCQGRKPCQLELAYSGALPQEWKFMVLQKQAWEVTLRPSTVQEHQQPQPTAQPSTVQKHQQPQPITQPSTVPTHLRPSTPTQPTTARPRTWQVRHRRRKDWDPYRLWLRRRLDVTATGVLPRRATALERRWQPNGAPTLLDSLKGWDSNNLIRQSGNFVYEKGQLRYRTWWIHPPHGVIHRIAQQRIRLHFKRSSKRKRKPKFFHTKFQKKPSSKPLVPVLLTLQRIETWRTRTLGTVGRFPARRCPSLSVGGWVSRPHRAGYWLVSPTGCYLTLGPTWQRSDPVPLMTHLQQRAKDQRRSLPSFWALAWLLFGGPFCLLLGWLWGPHLTQSSSVSENPSVFALSLPFLALLFFLLTAIYPWLQWRTFL